MGIASNKCLTDPCQHPTRNRRSSVSSPSIQWEFEYPYQESTASRLDKQRKVALKTQRTPTKAPKDSEDGSHESMQKVTQSVHQTNNYQTLLCRWLHVPHLSQREKDCGGVRGTKGPHDIERPKAQAIHG
mmetsp:Transcript_2743/g.17104  ORF Transcript_2743/g.17104 Transcript_2743/m.17104 type:complete len:130 (+) Transcript_2743:212-601(+)